MVNKAEPLTDEGEFVACLRLPHAHSTAVWEIIKPSLIKLLGKIKAEREADRLARNKRRRRDHLRNSYNVLLHAVAEDERAFFPLLGDFVFLSTVRKFWEPDDATFSETAWAHNLDEVFEGIHQHSKAVYAEAARIVLAATTENDYDELDEDPSAYDIETYEAAFSDKPTSYLFCALPTCHHFRRLKRAYFGSLPDLLQQQHDVHSSDEFDCLGIGHFRLPVGVASTVSAVTELAGLANDTATAKDLNALSWRLRWDNVFARQKWRTWDELVRASLSLPEVPAQASPRRPRRSTSDSVKYPRTAFLQSPSSSWIHSFPLSSLHKYFPSLLRLFTSPCYALRNQ